MCPCAQRASDGLLALQHQDFDKWVTREATGPALGLTTIGNPVLPIRMCRSPRAQSCRFAEPRPLFASAALQVNINENNVLMLGAERPTSDPDHLPAPLLMCDPR